MGYEYRISFSSPHAEAVSRLLRALPDSQELPGQPERFELRRGGGREGMPDAIGETTPYGLYYCYYGVAGRELLGTLLARLASEVGPVTLAELEDGAGSAIRLAAAGNTVVPAYLALLQKGYRVWRELVGGPGEVWRAEGPCELIAEDPVTLLGLAALYETRGAEWGAADAEIDAFLERFPEE